MTLKLQKKEGAKVVQGGLLKIVGRVEGVAEPVTIATAPVSRLSDRTEYLWLIVKPAAKPKKK